jgi:hypothetical protein
MPPIKYICKRCIDFNTYRFTDLKKHICRKNLCNKKKELLLISDDQILISTLMPYHNEIHSIDIKDIEHLSNSDIINKNKEELFNEIINIEKNKCKICKYCNKDFSIVLDLKKHIILNCYFNELSKRNYINNISNINISNNTINSNNTTNYNINNINNINNNNINNNINLYIGLNPPIPFEDNWDLSKISNSEQFQIMMSEFMYSQLLESILENELNNNVIIDSNKKSGMVYINHNDKYITMKSKKIIEKSMEKLNEHLNTINQNNKDKCLKEVIRYSRQIFNKKYIDYQKDKDIKKGVSNLFCNIYENNKEKATKLAHNIIKIEELDKQKKILEQIILEEINNENYDSDNDNNYGNDKKIDKGY